MNPEIRDSSLTVTKAFPAANANNSSAGLQIGGGATYARRSGLEIVVEIPANSTLVATKKMTLTPQQSSDDGSSDAYARIPQLAAVEIVGKSGNGTPTTSGSGYIVLDNGNILVAWPCPRDMEEYVNVNVAIESGGGDLQALSYTVSVVGY